MIAVVPDGMVLRADPAVLPPADLAGQADLADPAGKAGRADPVRRVGLLVRARTATTGRVGTRVDVAGNAVNPWRLPFRSRR